VSETIPYIRKRHSKTKHSRNQTVRKNMKEAEAELGQAQPKLRLRLKMEDFN